MAEQNIVSITIQEDSESHQENTSLKIELDEDTSIQQLLEYLHDQNKIVVELDNIEVLCGKHIISNNSLIKDAIISGHKIELIIRVKNSNNNHPPPPVPKLNPVTIQKEKNPNDVVSIEQSNLDIPQTGQLSQTNLLQKELQQKQLLKQKQQKANFIAAQQVAHQKGPKLNQQTLTLVIELIDGSTQISIDFQVGATQCWDDIKPRLYDYIASKNYLDHWSKQQQIKLQNNGHTYRKSKIPFKNLNMAVNGKIKFKITRMFPGGSQ